MVQIKIHAGDFLTGYSTYVAGGFRLKTQEHRVRGEFIALDEVESFEVKAEEVVQKVGDVLGLAAIGSLLLGPIGLLTGLLMGGKNKEVIFSVKFKDGRRFLATADSQTFTKMRAEMFQKNIVVGEMGIDDPSKQV